MKNIKWDVNDHITGMDFNPTWQIKKIPTPVVQPKKKSIKST